MTVMLKIGIHIDLRNVEMLNSPHYVCPNMSQTKLIADEFVLRGLFDVKHIDDSLYSGSSYYVRTNKGEEIYQRIMSFVQNIFDETK